MSRRGTAPTLEEFGEALRSVENLLWFCRNFYTMMDTTDLELIRDSLEDDLADFEEPR